MTHDVAIHIYLHIDLPETGRRVRHAEAEEQPKEATLVGSAVESMLNRLEAFDPSSNVRKMGEHMIRTGWAAYPPQPRGQRSTSDGNYLRCVYVGKLRRVVLYLGSTALVSAGTAERTVMAALGHADPRTAREVYFFHSPNRTGANFSLELSLDAADALQRWADGL